MVEVERLHVAEATVGLTADAVGMLVPIARRSRLLHREKQQLLLLPDLHRVPASSREILAGGGRSVLIERALHLEGEGLSPMVRQRSEAVCRLMLATLEIDELNYRPDPDPLRSPYVAGAADGERVAVLQPSHVGPVGQMQYNWDARMSLWLGQFDGVPLRHVFEVVAIVACEPDDYPVQWSPDERWIAVSLALTASREVAPISTV